MPVFPVGVGKERMTRDVQVTRVETPRRALKGTSLVLDLVVTQTGYAGVKVPLIVEDEGRIVSTQDITLPGDGESRDGQGPVEDDGRRVARVSVPRAGAGKRGSRAEQPARRAHRSLQPPREDPVPRGRAAARAEVHPAGDRRGRQPAGRAAPAHGAGDGQRAGQVPAARRRRAGGAGGRVSRRRARSCSGIARSSSAASRRRRSRPSSSACSRTSWTSAAAGCSCSAAPGRSPKAGGRARRWPTRCRWCSIARRAGPSIRRRNWSCGRPAPG